MLALFLLACSGTTPDAADADGDDTADPHDCAPDDPAIHPGAEESCNKLDDNCDGEVDEGVLVDVWPDQDGDGYGNGSSPLQGCPVGGWAGANGDCDDVDPAVHPGAEDVCNGVDDDCDGVKDSTDTTWYADNDGDGYGDDTTATVTCTPPTGFIATGGDCDDAAAAVNPGAVELCNGADDDCDGSGDLGYEADWHSDADGDGYGSPLEHEVTCTPPAGWVLDGTDCRPSDAAAFPGAIEVCNGVDDSCDGLSDEGFDLDGDGHQVDSCPTGDDCDDHDPASFLDAHETCGDGVDQDCDGLDLHCGYQGTYALADADVRATGASVGASAGHFDHGDVDGDGYEDLVLNSLYSGLMVVKGPISGAVDIESESTEFLGDLSRVYGGRSIGVGDVNDDGLDDVGFGAPYGTYEGLYILFGPADTDTDGEDADVVILGITGTYPGHGAELADITGDGIADGIMGAWGTNSSQGTTYIFAGPLSGDYSYSAADITITSHTAGEYSSRWLRGDGDLDGDGLDDLLIAAPYASVSASAGGVIYVFLAPLSGDYAMTDADARLLGATSAGYMGEYHTMAMGDSDGDGRDDALVFGYYAGAGALFFSPTSGDYETSSADMQFSGTSYFGSGLALEDIDGNGVGDVLIGSSAAGAYTGASYLFWDLKPGSYTAADADGTFEGETASYAGTAGCFGDFSGDGWPDVAIGAPSLDLNGGFYIENQVR